MLLLLMLLPVIVNFCIAYNSIGSFLAPHGRYCTYVVVQEIVCKLADPKRDLNALILSYKCKKTVISCVQDVQDGIFPINRFITF